MCMSWLLDYSPLLNLARPWRSFKAIGPVKAVYCAIAPGPAIAVVSFVSTCDLVNYCAGIPMLNTAPIATGPANESNPSNAATKSTPQVA